MAGHRLFLAIDASEKLQSAAQSWLRKHAQFPVRPQRLKNLHITLVPP